MSRGDRERQKETNQRSHQDSGERFEVIKRWALFSRFHSESVN